MNNLKGILTDDEVYAIENGEGINDGIYGDEYYDDEEAYAKYCEIEYRGYLEWAIDENIKAEKALMTSNDAVLHSIGERSYNYLKELLKKDKIHLLEAEFEFINPNATEFEKFDYAYYNLERGLD